MNWNQVIMEIIDFWGVPLVLLKIILITFLNFTESFQPHKKWSYIITKENKQQFFNLTLYLEILVHKSLHYFNLRSR